MIPKELTGSKTRNFFFANDNNGSLYQLILNEYIFFIYPEEGKLLEKFDFLNNVKNDIIIVGKVNCFSPLNSRTRL